jgi:hypothetical protein
VPLSIYVRAVVKGVVVGVVVFVLAAGVATLMWLVCVDWFGPPIAEREDWARAGLLACCILVSILIGAEVAAQEFRQRTQAQRP